MTQGPLVAVCVATYKRPRYLSDLLSSIAEVEIDGYSAHLIVADNDPDETAREVVESYAARFPIPVTYTVETERGIAFARNRLVRTAHDLEASYVAFVDDDQIVEPTWLQALINAANEWQVEAVVGYWRPRFETGVPNWILESRFWDRPYRRSGYPAVNFGTNNILIKLNPMLEVPGPFDVSLQLIGGEDTIFFDQFLKKGNRAFWCEDSLVYERIPVSRANAKWMTQRMYRIGHVNAIRFTRDEPPVVDRIRFATKCAARIVKHMALLFTLNSLRGRARFVERLTNLAEACGRFVGCFGWTYQEYRNVHGE
jgi:succinoglycan biosynthesis protein ExoM